MFANTGQRPSPEMFIFSLTKEDANELYSVIGRVEGLAGRITAELPKVKRMAIVHQLKHLNQQPGEIKGDAVKMERCMQVNWEMAANA